MTLPVAPPAARPETLLTADALEGDRVQPGHPLFGIVWVNTQRMSGTPCFACTRVPVQNLFDYLEGGDTLSEFLEGFPGVSCDQALAVLAVARARFLEGLAVR